MLEISPILVTGYRRPVLLKNLVDHLLQFTAPSNLYLSVDGILGSKPEHVIEIKQSQEIIREYVTLGVHHFLPERNLGCYLGNKEAIGWFFNQVESGIVLEDDMWPNKDFLYMATEGLRHFENDPKVGSISGTNIVPRAELERFGATGIFRFSKYSSSWGWATWANRWQHFVATADDREIQKVTRNAITSGVARRYWDQIMRMTYHNQNDSWAYRWLFTHWQQDWLALTPNLNLVTNLGFGLRATHTKEVDVPWWVQESVALPENTDLISSFRETRTRPNAGADSWMETNHFRVGRSLLRNSMKEHGFQYLISAFDRVRGN